MFVIAINQFKNIELGRLFLLLGRAKEKFAATSLCHFRTFLFFNDMK